MRYESHRLLTRWGVWRLLWRRKKMLNHLSISNDRNWYFCMFDGIYYYISSYYTSRCKHININSYSVSLYKYFFQTRHQLAWKFRPHSRQGLYASWNYYQRNYTSILDIVRKKSFGSNSKLLPKEFQRSIVRRNWYIIFLLPKGCFAIF